MLDIEKLKELDYVMDNLKEVTEMFKSTETAIKLVKEHYKETKESTVDDDKEVNYSTYNKFVATDMEKLQAAYPMEDHPTMYSISITKEASSIVMEEDLLGLVPVEKVTFKFN